MTTVGLDAKRIVRNGTGLGSYGRTLVNDLIRLGDDQLELVLLLITVLAAAVVILTIITLTYRDKSRARTNRKEWGK